MSKPKTTVSAITPEYLLEIIKQEGTIMGIENKCAKNAGNNQPGHTLNDIAKDFGYRVMFENIEFEELANVLSDIGFDNSYIILGLTNMAMLVEKKTEMTKKAYSIENILKAKDKAKNGSY